MNGNVQQRQSKTNRETKQQTTKILTILIVVYTLRTRQQIQSWAFKIYFEFADKKQLLATDE